MRFPLKMAFPLVASAGLSISLVGVPAATAVQRSAVTAHSGVGYVKPSIPNWFTPNCIITSSPARFVETGVASAFASVAFVLQTECKPLFAGEAVDIKAPQLYRACHDNLSWYSATGTGGVAPSMGTGKEFTVVLDNDGNATAVAWGGPSCAASTDQIAARLTVAPFTWTATKVKIMAPRVTSEGLSAYPPSEVEDSNTSSVAVIFYAEFPATYAMDPVEFADSGLNAACAGGITWVGPDAVILGTGATAATTLDDNGNAFVVALAGPGCTAGKTVASTSLLVPPNTPFAANFRVLLPRVIL